MCPFLAHDILEILGEVIDHCVPDPFIGVPATSFEVLIQLSRYLFYSKVHLWSSKVSKEQHCSLHRVVHGLGVFVNALINAPAGHKLFDFVSISHEDLGIFSYQFIQECPWVSCIVMALRIRFASSTTFTTAATTPWVISTSTTSIPSDQASSSISLVRFRRIISTSISLTVL